MIRSRLKRMLLGVMLVSMPLLAFGAMDKTQEWVGVLQSDAPIFEKVRACQQLGEFGSKNAVPVLASLLNDPRLSTYARNGLERIPGPGARAALRAALDQTQGHQLVGVVYSIGVLRDERAVPALIALMRDPDPELAKATRLSLGRIANTQAVGVLHRALSTGPDRSRPDAAAACLLAAEQQLAQGHADMAQALYDAVRQAPVPASYRIGATRGAIVSRRSDRIAFLVEQLRSDDPALRDVALLTIREVPSAQLATALNAELERAPRDLQRQILLALKDCHNSQSLRIISTKAVSPDSELRLTALKVLRDIGATESAATFLKVLHDPRGQEELSIAMSSLELMGGPDIDALILKAVQSSPGANARVQLIRLLGRRHVAAAKEELLRQASDRDPKVSMAAYQALKSLADQEDLPELIALTKACRHSAVRDAAAATLYTVSKNNDQIDRAGALILRELDRSMDSAEKASWIRVLTMLGYAPALSTITATLQDSDQQLVQSTIAQLGRWPNPAPVQDLFAVVEGDAGVNTRRRALIAILQLATNAANQGLAADEELLAWYRRARKAARTVQEKRLLISGLGRVKHIKAVQLLASFLGDPEVTLEAVHAIVNASGPLVKGEDYQAVETVLKQISGVQDQRLLGQIQKLQRDIQATAARRRQ